MPGLPADLDETIRRALAEDVGAGDVTTESIVPAGTESVILCTRKTLPGLRALERYAVEVGGGVLHRAGLFDAVLIKDNHGAIAGGVGEAIRRSRAATRLPVEVEVETLEQLGEAL